MNRAQLFEEIKIKRSYLCVGLDTDVKKIPPHLLKFEDPVFEFNKQIIDATHEYCIAYKPNVAFYESLGPSGWESLQKTVDYIPDNCLTIADAKRGDIGNTSTMYAKTFFSKMNFDAITVAPYMGEDSVKPFLQFKNKWVIILVHTSNPGSADFQLIESKVTGRKLYEEVILTAQRWGSADQVMFVVGATQSEKMKSIRNLAPEHFLLVPGIGAQGGELAATSSAGMNSQCGLIVNSSRSIIYASRESDFGSAAARESQKLQQEMAKHLDAVL
jgi:orotidine-5'-phosphate decarboxylase